MWTHRVVSTNDPAPLTLQVMGHTAELAANTPAFKEWASRLATRAGPRDYVGQLRKLYDGILRRWRYVMEPNEWIHGSAPSLIAHVLGTKYNGGPNDATLANLEELPAGEKGWGDCDDVSTVVAAGVRALGMTPMFRVARGPTGAHVSVIARTPRGEMISVDPVGAPSAPLRMEVAGGGCSAFWDGRQPANHSHLRRS